MNEYTSKNTDTSIILKHTLSLCVSTESSYLKVILMIQLNPAFLKNPITVNSTSISWNLIRITFIFWLLILEIYHLLPFSEGWNRNLLMSCGTNMLNSWLITSEKNTLSGVMAILCVLLVKPILILYANILKIKVNGIHSIDRRSMVFCQKLYKRLCLLFYNIKNQRHNLF